MPESVDWSRRGKYMFERHGVSVSIADDVLSDPNRVVIDPDYAQHIGTKRANHRLLAHRR